MNSDIKNVLAKFINTPDCVLQRRSESNLILSENLSLPDDVAYFYQLYDSAIFYEDSPYPFYISSPTEFVKTDVVIFNFMAADELANYAKNSVTLNWYLIGQGESSQYVSIDLSPERKGWCFNSNWQIHAGESYVIAKSFTEFLHRLVESKGNYQFWDTIPDNERVYPKDLVGK